MNNVTYCLRGKKLILGITGGIAAYKSAELVRRLREAGCEVRVVMTTGGQAFVSALTFQALSGNPVHTDLLDPAAESAMGHIQLARWADIILLAPCTANTLAKLAHGLADNLLTTLVLASSAPLAIAPAMNRIMWENPATQANLDILLARQVKILGPNSGSQACGEEGSGRMLEPAELLLQLSCLFQNTALSGRTVMITAGPTREAIDPVRFISNHSSGKMGYALAQAAQAAGANIILISGPVNIPAPTGMTVIRTESAQEMFDAVMQKISAADIFISTAAVADYRVQIPANQKIKKSTFSSMTLTLQLNPDILASVANLAEPPFTVGFAAETEQLVEQAKSKLHSKKVNMIAANWVGENASTGFNTDENALEVFWQTKQQTEFRSLGPSQKSLLARQLIELIAERYSASFAGKLESTHDTKNSDKNP